MLSPLRSEDEFPVDDSPQEEEVFYSAEDAPWRPGGPRWGVIVVGGVLFALTVFMFLAFIQPVTQKDQAKALPPINFNLEAPPKKKSTKPPEQDQKRKSKPRPQRKKPKAKPKKIQRKAAPRQVRRPTAAPSPIQNLGASFGGGSISIGVGTGGGGGIQINSGDLEFDLVEEEANELEELEIMRQEIRERGNQFERDGVVTDDAPGVAQKVVPVLVPTPPYPDRARKKEVEGHVLLNVLVSVEGRVERYEIIRAEPEGFFEDAIDDAVGSWTFRAAQDAAGRPIEAWSKFRIDFKLEDA